MATERKPAKTENRSRKETILEKEFVSENELDELGIRSKYASRRDRLFGRGFPYYKFHGSVRYNLQECLEIVRKNRRSGGGEAA